MRLGSAVIRVLLRATVIKAMPPPPQSTCKSTLRYTVMHTLLLYLWKVISNLLNIFIKVRMTFCIEDIYYYLFSLS